MRYFLIALAGCALSACATGASNSYEEDMQALTEACDARGGILIPAPESRTTDRVELNYFCEVHGASRIRDAQD